MKKNIVVKKNCIKSTKRSTHGASIDVDIYVYVICILYFLTGVIDKILLQKDEVHKVFVVKKYKN